ncbi:MAG: Ig-like domain repeat protein [Armatimonadetes bacterium]|nr:Ig-like domain repeat protein [Armatimonadota bacterium]
MERSTRPAFAHALAVAVLSALQVSSVAQPAPVWELAAPNPRFVEYQLHPPTQPGLTPSPVDYSHADGVPVHGAIRRLGPIPTAYDLRALGRTTAVRQQDTCGTCWVFASYASLEGALLPGERWDFSENHVKNTSGFGGDPCVGGNQHKVLAYLARWSGPVTEADDPYVPYASTSPTGLTVRKHLQNVLFLPNRTGPLDTTAIKRAIMDVGPVYTPMTWSSAQMNPATNAYYYYGNRIDNHAVAIVGWDDGYAQSRFLRRPSGPGAWICKNSQGIYHDDGVYFYVSYYDSSIAYDVTVFTAGEDTTNYSRNYQYDPMGDTGYIGCGSNTAFYSNVFTAEATEPVVAAAFYAASPGTSYTVRLYTDVGATPTSGRLASSASGVTPTAGYFTAPIPPATVLAGSRFAVAVEVTTPTTVKPIPVEYYINGYSHCTSNPGESWISADGVSWSDMATVIKHANVCVKAFTSGAKPTSLSVVDASGSAGQSLTLSAKLVRSVDLAALAGKAVRFAVDGQDLGAASTSASGVAAMPYTVPVGLAAGTHPIACRFDGDGDLGGSQAVGSLVVAKVGMALTMQPASGVPGQVVGLSAVLSVALTGAPAQGRSLEFAVSGTAVGTVSTDAAGQASLAYTVPGDAAEGSLPTTASFAGDAQRSPVTCSSTLAVTKGASVVTVSAVSGYVGRALTLSASASRAVDGRPLAGAALSFSVDGVAVGSAVAGASGDAHLGYSPVEALRGRSVDVAVAFAGGAGQLPAAGSGQLAVAQYDTTLAVPDVTATVGSAVALRATLCRVGSGPIGSAAVSFSVSGVDVGDGATDADGVASVAYTFAPDFLAGSLPIRAAFAGLANEGPSVGAGLLSIGGTPSVLAVGSRTAQFGQTVSLSGVLTSSLDGKALRGYTVSVSLDGTALGTGVTDSTGAGGIRWTVPTTVAAGPHKTTVSFAGNAAYGPSEGSGTLTVTTADSLLSIAPVTAAPGQTVDLIAVLRHGITLVGQPGKVVAFKMASTALGSATTDGTGTATFEMALPLDTGAGTYASSASFAGDTWLGCRSASSTLTVLGQASTTLSLRALSAEPGEAVGLDALLLRSSDSCPLAGLAVAFTVDGAAVGSAMTDAAGHAVLSYTVAATAGIGSLATSAAFGGTASYAAAAASSSITVVRFATAMSVPNVVGRAGQAAVLRAVLCRAASGSAVPGATVAFSIDGLAVGATVTNAAGSAELPYTPPATMAGGLHPVGAAFTGSVVDAPSSGSAALSIGLTDVVYSISTQSGSATQTVALSSRIRRKQDLAALSGLVVTVKVVGTAVGAATTGADGLAVVRWYIAPGTTAGAKAVVGEFAGTASYAAASASTSLTVLAKAPTYCWVGSKTVTVGATATLVGFLYQVMPDGALPPLAGKPTTWSVDGARVGACTSALDGRCSATYSVPATWAAGSKHTLQLEYAPGADPVYSGSVGSAQLTVN